MVAATQHLLHTPCRTCIMGVNSTSLSPLMKLLQKLRWLQKLVSWSLTSPFSTKNGYIRDKRSGVERYRYPVKEGQWYINLNPGPLFVQQPPKRERDQEAHSNYYASAYNSGRQLSHHKTKLNLIQQNTRINLN